MLITLKFLVVAMKSRTFFPISHIQLTSRCAGAGREHSQAESLDGQWKCSIPQTSCPVCEWGWLGCRKLSALLCSRSMNPLLSGSLNFFGNFMKFGISMGSMVSARGLAAN